ncbi:MAG: hypothetical protein WD397_14940, partial [Wenzhouxiangellaceae bacterium]
PANSGSRQHHLKILSYALSKWHSWNLLPPPVPAFHFGQVGGSFDSVGRRDESAAQAANALSGIWITT